MKILELLLILNDADFGKGGCPAMGAEVLEEEEFQPMFDSCESNWEEKELPYSAHMAGETALRAALA